MQTLVDIHKGNVESGGTELKSEQAAHTREDSEDESTSIDLMARNDEDNEEVESENKDDLQFLERTGKLDME